MDKLHRFWKRVVDVLDPAGDWVALLPIRLLMAYEYGKAGAMKFNGKNWFANVQDNFPFPFNVIPTEISWFLATWFEILGARTRTRTVHQILGRQSRHSDDRRNRRGTLAG